MKKLYSITYPYGDPFGLFDSVTTIEKLSELKTDGVMILWGGADIGTAIYGQKPNRFVHANIPSGRDRFEMAVIDYCIEHNVPMIGVCRGAQLLCAMAGGELLQHIENHGTAHDVTLHDEGDVVIRCNSSHHQMMLPNNCEHKLLASSGPTTGINEYNKAVPVERVNEVVYFPQLRALGIQPHPEWDDCSKEFVDYCRRKIIEYLF